MMKKLKNYIMAFILPFIICIFILYLKDILFNIENIYVSDLRLQHVVFLNYFKSILLGDASVQYSFYAGMGTPMISTMIFYAISPVNLLLFFINDIRYAVVFIYIVKMSLSGLTMYILLKSRRSQDNFMTVLFSTCYALSAFIINYFFCIFWFDSVYLAPLVMLGIDRMFERERFSLIYIFSLGLAIICNIQMGFGLCVYSVVYYIYSYNIRYSIKKDFKKFIHMGIIFAISSLCAGAISSGILLGFVTDYSNISVARDIMVTTRAGTSNIGYVIKNFFTVGNLKTDYYNDYEPFIYCGLIVSFFSILYFFNKNIDSKKRLHALGVILVFIISFSINSLNLFWHLSSPVLLNFRYSIYLALFLTVLAYESYSKIDKLSKTDIVVLIISLFVGLSVIVLYVNEVYVLYTFIFLVLICLLIYLTKNKNKKFGVLLSLAVVAEMVVNGYASIYTASQLPFGKYSSYDELKKEDSLNHYNDDYRVLYNYSYTDFTNDTMLLNHHSSLRYFSSVINGNLLNFYNRNLSCVGNNNYRVSAYDSPLLLSLMGNKYFYLTDEFNNDMFQLIDSYSFRSYDYTLGHDNTKKVYLYENPYALGIGYVINKDFSYKKGMDLIDYQNGIIKAFSGSDKDVMIRLNYTSSTDSESCLNHRDYSCVNYNIDNPTNNPFVYVYTNFKSYNLNNQVTIYGDSERPLLISSLDKKLDLTLTSDVDLTKEFFSVSTYNKFNLIDSLSILQKNMIKNVKINKNIMKAEIDSSRDGILFLSIPYDNYYQIFVDGKRVKYFSLLNDAFVGLDIKNGHHDIKIKYENESYQLYFVLTGVSIFVTLGLCYVLNMKIAKRQDEEKKRLALELEKKMNRKSKKSKKKVKK